MERAIVRKLTDEFAQQIISERQIVYILVELRKLLEKKADLDSYRALGFCCDWAAHPKLERSPAQKIIKLFDQYEAKYRREAVGLSQAGIPELVDFCEHTRFRAELIAACESNGIHTNAPRDDGWWRSFVMHFSEVVRDCPLEARAENIVYVTRVTASAMNPEFAGIMNRKFAICWTWYRRGIEPPGTVMSLF